MKFIKNQKKSNANINWKSYLYIQLYLQNNNKKLLKKQKKVIENV